MRQLSPVQSRFLDLLLTSGALRFGEFKTKSGRMSPYFFNTGAFDHGAILREVAQCYASEIQTRYPGKAHLYGPAYKGITLAAAVSMELATLRNGEVPFTFNRKEAKDHGEGGQFVGRALKSDQPILIVEDVMTGGTSIRETMSLLAPLNIPVAGVVVGVDRQELGTGSELAAIETERRFKIPVTSILNMDEIIGTLWSPERDIERLGRVWIDRDVKKRIDQYRAAWGGISI